MGRKATGGDPPPPDKERCTRNDGKQWRCRQRRAKGESMCEYHANYARRGKPRVRVSTNEEGTKERTRRVKKVTLKGGEDERSLKNKRDLESSDGSSSQEDAFVVKSSDSQNYLDDDCIVLDGDLYKPIAVNDNERNGGNESDDLCIVGQKGQVACRDFPHSRHLCANFPFNTTSHEKHCKLCHCYVCDSPAPCLYWGNGVSLLSDHCHATDKNETWKSQRNLFKRITAKSIFSTKPS